MSACRRRRSLPSVGATDTVEAMRCLVTAGNTREAIDSVRMWSNIFTGNTGLRIAKALAEFATVDLLTSNPNHAGQAAGSTRLAIASFSSHAELRQSLQTMLAATHYDAIFMTAAVADYLPSDAFAICERRALPDGREQWVVEPAQRAKIKSTHETIAIVGKRSEKLVDLFRTAWHFRGLLVKFKLEVGLSREQLIEVGKASRIASGADFLVANTLDMVSGADAGAYLIGAGEPEWVSRAALPARLAVLVRDAPRR